MRPTRRLSVVARNLTRRLLPPAALLFLAMGPAAGPAAALSSRTVLTSTGAAGERNGTSVASGDVNGDGYQDQPVGASNASAGLGAVYIYFGGPVLHSTPDVILTGELASATFGFSISAGGDLNGDGIADVIVGAQSYIASTGRVYVFYGGPGLVSKGAASANATLTGEATNNIFGYSASIIPDVNGDGLADVLVGALANNSLAGRAYIFYGGPTLVTKGAAAASVILTGEAANNQFGVSVAGAGDVNGDGYGDVLVGANGYSTSIGRAYIFYGGTSLVSIGAGSANVILTGEASSNVFGQSVSTAGDMNGDGYADVLVGASGYTTNTGRAYVFYGGPALISKPAASANAILTGEGTNQFFGFSVASAGDVNGDGRADVIVGVIGYTINTGRAYVFLGGASLITEVASGADLILTGEAVNNQFCIALSTAGDVNGDGFSDVMIGASIFSSNAGRAYLKEVFPYLVVSPNGGEHWVAGQPASVRWLGRDPADVSISTDGGFSWGTLASGVGGSFDNTVSVIAPTQTGPGALVRVSQNGVVVSHSTSDRSDRAFSIFNGKIPSAVSQLQLTLSGAAASQFGGSLCSGDVNGDGFPDLIVGAPNAISSQGTVSIFFGGPGADASADVVLTGEAGASGFGVWVASAGDVNGDGIADVAVGASSYSANAGRAYIFYGGAALISKGAASADAILTGEAAGNNFGSRVAIGDVNGDGYGDLLVGAFGYVTNTGRAYVFYGGPTMVSESAALADVVLTGETTNNRFGSSIAPVGDVNGDGRADILVGAHTNASNIGRAYVFYGGSTLTSKGAAGADVILTGESAGFYFGTAVAAAGDVNGDGVPDMIVGGSGVSAFDGRAYVFFGGSSLASKGDGFPDLLVGAYGFGNNAGRAYLYDMKRYQVQSPNGGESWNVGATKSITWLGAEPADVWLSSDGGTNFSRVATGAGGAAHNFMDLRVPHAPSRFSVVKITTTDATLGGSDASDSLFTILTNIALLGLKAQILPTGGAEVSWSTNPGVGPAGISGYRLYRLAPGTSGDGVRVGPELITEARFVDAEASPGSSYRLSGVNGLGEELELGRVSLGAVRALSAWPLPYRGGDLNVVFAAPASSAIDATEVGIYDFSGRLVRRLVRGASGGAQQSLTWDGRDSRGSSVADGVYFLRAGSGGSVSHLKMAVVRAH